MQHERSSGWQTGAENSSGLITQPNRDLVKQLACGNWYAILVTHGIAAEYLVNKHGPCPVHGGNDPFRFDDKGGHGTFFCNSCGAGDGFTLLMRYRNWSFFDALRAVATFLQRGCVSADTGSGTREIAVSNNERKPDPAIARYNERLWNESTSITAASPPDLYLRSRNLLLSDYPDCLRWHPNLVYKSESGAPKRFPALIAAVQSSTGDMVALHRTYLTNGGEKAPVKTPKKLTKRLFDGATRGAAIRLFQPGEVLGVAEGIETAIAAFLTWKIPFWAAISAGGMERIEIPKTVKHVVIAADNDLSGRGEQAAVILARRLAGEGFTVQVLKPEQTSTDIADIIRGISNGT